MASLDDGIKDCSHQKNDGLNRRNDGLNRNDDGLNDELRKLHETLQRVYRAIAIRPEIKASELTEILSISDSTLKRATRTLKKLGFIKREGSKKTGKWVILK